MPLTSMKKNILLTITLFLLGLSAAGAGALAQSTDTAATLPQPTPQQPSPAPDQPPATPGIAPLPSGGNLGLGLYNVGVSLLHADGLPSDNFILRVSPLNQSLSGCPPLKDIAYESKFESSTLTITLMDPEIDDRSEEHTSELQSH